ncbi:MAG: TolB family protein [Gaiellaceae bacterium]
MLALAVAGGAAGDSSDGRQLVYAGARLAFEEGGPRADQVTDLFVVRADGTPLRRPTRTTDSEDAPGWSPDGGRVAYSRGTPSCHANACRGALKADIWTLSLAAGTPRRLTRGRAQGLIDTSPAWSPDGTQIAFSRRACCDVSPADGVYTVGADGTGVRRLADVRALALDWGPGGGTLAVSVEGAAV